MSEHRSIFDSWRVVSWCNFYNMDEGRGLRGVLNPLSRSDNPVSSREDRRRRRRFLSQYRWKWSCSGSGFIFHNVGFRSAFSFFLGEFVWLRLSPLSQDIISLVPNSHLYTSGMFSSLHAILRCQGLLPVIIVLVKGTTPLSVPPSLPPGSIRRRPCHPCM